MRRTSHRTRVRALRHHELQPAPSPRVLAVLISSSTAACPLLYRCALLPEVQPPLARRDGYSSFRLWRWRATQRQRGRRSPTRRHASALRRLPHAFQDLTYRLRIRDHTDHVATSMAARATQDVFREHPLQEICPANSSGALRLFLRALRAVCTGSVRVLRRLVNHRTRHHPIAQWRRWSQHPLVCQLMLTRMRHNRRQPSDELVRRQEEPLGPIAPYPGQRP